MFSPLKIFRTDTNRVFFWSDLHLGHEKDFVLNPRGFKSAEEGISSLVGKWNSIVSAGDVGFLLGDSVVGAGENGKQLFEFLLDSLRCKELYLMPGNHPSGYKQVYQQILREGNQIDEFLRLKTESYGRPVYLIPNYFEISVCKKHLVLSHYPIISWNGQAKNSIHLHGHCHGSLSNSEIGKIYYSANSFDVGVENFQFPVEFNEIVSKVYQTVVFDHHE